MLDEVKMQQNAGGILIHGKDKSDADFACQAFFQLASSLGISQLLHADNDDGFHVRFRLHPHGYRQHYEIFDTMQLCDDFNLSPSDNPADLEKEILLAMLLAPVTFPYPSYTEFAASVKIRMNIVEAARRTALAFHTSKIERPTDYWTYSENKGFTVLPGKQLIEALICASQPAVSGERYAFSCYRATEYVILLGIAQELATRNPELLNQLQRQWESRAIMSRQFHEVFLNEFGSMDEPLPPKYYVPGDRLWFRNPDERSAEVTGYEGSWVFYIGNGLFTNFWERDQPFTLAAKCIEIYHWRFGVYQDADGNLQMDENIVKQRVQATLQDPAETERILDLMIRLRDPQDVYADGGCIDASREYPRCVCPGTADLVLPGQ